MAQYTDYASSMITYYKKQYAITHEITIKNFKEKGVEIKKIIFTLLDENPALTLKELAKSANCDLTVVVKYRKQYAETHEITIKNTREMGPKIRKNIFDLLDKDPSLSGGKLAKLVNCSEAAAGKFKKHWQEIHQQKIEKPAKQSKEIILTLLGKNPALSRHELAKLANCEHHYAQKVKKQWLQLHSAEPPQDEASAD